MALIIQVTDDRRFTQDNRILVEWGTTTKELKPHRSIFGL
jgi:hypothetical protein